MELTQEQLDLMHSTGFAEGELSELAKELTKKNSSTCRYEKAFEYGFVALHQGRIWRARTRSTSTHTDS
jgi:hypothetical protein